MQTLSAVDPRALLRAEVDAQELKRALDQVKPAVVARSAVPALRSVLVQADRAGLTVCATNPELTINSRLNAAATVPGSAVVSFARLRAVVGRLRGAVVLELSSQDTELLTVAAGAGATRTGLATLALADFTGASFRGVGDATPLDLVAVRRVLPAASKDPARPLFGAVLLDGNDIVATDSYRLHVERVSERLPRCILPASALTAVAATRHRSASLRVDRLANLAQLTVPGAEFIVRPLPEGWVDYKRLIPRPSDTDVIATLRADDLLNAAAELRPLAGSTSSPPPAWLSVAPRRVTISLDAPGVGRGEVELDAEVRGGESTADVAFNAAFLSASVRACDSQRISIHIRGPRKPAVIVAEGADWDRPGNGLRLLMPVFADRPAAVVNRPASDAPPEAVARDEDAGAPDDVVTLRELRSRRPMRRRSARP